MKKIPSFLVVSRYNEDYSWIYDYVDGDNYLIYNKGEKINNDPHVLNVPNIGGNQRDIFEFCYSHYKKLPNTVAFTQAYPWDHCPLDFFKKLIYNEFFTPLEFYGFTPANGLEGRTENGNFLEGNVPWYIASHNKTYGLTCRYSSLDEFMNKYFENYFHVDYIPFAPGSQLIIEKSQILQYPRKFWKQMRNELDGFNMTEAHVIERSLTLIFTGGLKLRDEFE